MPAAVAGAEDELDDLAIVEVAANELGVGLVFLEGHDGEVVGDHDGLADGGDALEEVLGEGGGGAGEGLDEGDTGVWVLVASVETLDADGHCDCMELPRTVKISLNIGHCRERVDARIVGVVVARRKAWPVRHCALADTKQPPSHMVKIYKG